MAASEAAIFSAVTRWAAAGGWGGIGGGDQGSGECPQQKNVGEHPPYQAPLFQQSLQTHTSTSTSTAPIFQAPLPPTQQHPQAHSSTSDSTPQPIQAPPSTPIAPARTTTSSLGNKREYLLSTSPGKSPRVQESRVQESCQERLPLVHEASNVLHVLSLVRFPLMKPQVRSCCVSVVLSAARAVAGVLSPHEATGEVLLCVIFAQWCMCCRFPLMKPQVSCLRKSGVALLTGAITNNVGCFLLPIVFAPWPLIVASFHFFLLIKNQEPYILSVQPQLAFQLSYWSLGAPYKEVAVLVSGCPFALDGLWVLRSLPTVSGCPL